MVIRDNKINNWPIIIFSIFLWFVGLSYGSGLGQFYHVYERTEIIVGGIAAFCFLRRKTSYMIKKERAVIIFGLLFCIIVSYIRGQKGYLEYLWLYLIIYIFSCTTITKGDLKIVALAYGGLGGAVLTIAKYSHIFAGWDGNSISMVAFFSYTVFSAGILENLKRKEKIFFAIYTAYYFSLLNLLDSRGSILFSIVLILGVLNIIPFSLFFHKKNISVFLLVPLMTALFIVLIRNQSFVQNLNMWSYATFGKPIFNGRDEIWNRGFQEFLAKPLFGNGSFAGNWHNSAVTVLAGSGVIGFFSFFRFFKIIMLRGCYYINDGAVLGLLSACIVVWMQQSVELGLVQVRANSIIFVIFGLLMARVNTVESVMCLENE